jgi:hypothetical protein
MALRSVNPARPPEGPPLPSRRWQRRLASGLTVLAALLVFAGGYEHYCLYRHGYRFIPKIGPSFLLQFTSSAVLGVALLVLLFPRWSVHVGRWRFAVLQLARLAAIGLNVGTLGALAIAHTKGGLFGFREVGLNPAPQTLLTIIFEWEAASLLGVAMLFAYLAGRKRTAVPVEVPVAEVKHPPRSAA